MIIYSFKWWIPFSHSIETVGSTSSFTNEVGPSNVFDKITWLNPDTTESNHLKALFTLKMILKKNQIKYYSF